MVHPPSKTGPVTWATPNHGYNGGWKPKEPRMFRTQLPRIYELRDLTADPTSPDAYFQNFDEYVQDSLHVRQIYARWEKDLQGLDHDA